MYYCDQIFYTSPIFPSHPDSVVSLRSVFHLAVLGSIPFGSFSNFFFEKKRYLSGKNSKLSCIQSRPKKIRFGYINLPLVSVPIEVEIPTVPYLKTPVNCKLKY